MRALWKCCKWEFLQSELAGPGGILVLIFGLAYGWNAARSWNGNGVPVILSALLVFCTVLAVCRAMQWPYSGAFALERTSGRAAWQSIGGRVLCWALVLAAAAGIQQVFFRRCMEQIATIWPKLFADGADRVTRLAHWIGWRGFLSIWVMSLGVYILALTIALTAKSGVNRHRASLARAVGNAAAVTGMGWCIWWIFPLPLPLVGAGAVLIGLPLRGWLLEKKAE